jgi:SpoVK/Ycf46/Vps4 family AAA+-type ATPase
MGYDSVLEELVALARTFDDPRDVAPTAVVLTGCGGVGKSRMALLFKRELSRVYGGSSYLKSVAISAKDILLEEASSSFDHRVAYNVGDNCSETKQLLIIDDLDVIIGDSDVMGSSFTTNGSDLQSEQLRALNAIVNLVDAAVVRKDFVLGICRTPLSRLPPQLARVGRFEKEVVMSSPSLMQRKDIFGYWLSTLPLAGKTTDVQRWADLLAPRTAGCVAADIRRVCADALTSAAARVPQTSSINNSIVTWEDMKEAAWTCIPSELSSLDVIQCPRYDESSDSKDIFQLAWKNFGGYEEEKKRLYRTVVRPWMYHITESTSLPGMSKPSGVLFHGPSGCGKSMAALALASSLGLNCVKVTASEVFNQWLGGSEQRLRSIFSRARVAAPCILFFDELDALAANREGGESDATSGVQSRILTTLLNEMDGITTAGGDQDVLIVAATNRLDSIDAALLRPGRLEEHILLSHPKSTSIHEILMIHTAKMPVDESVDLVLFSRMLKESMTSCAEIEGICRDACLIAIRRCSDNGKLDNLSVSTLDFNEAFNRIKMRS